MFGKVLDVWKRSFPEPRMILFIPQEACKCLCLTQREWWGKSLKNTARPPSHLYAALFMFIFLSVSFLRKLDAEELWFTLENWFWNKKCLKFKSSKRIVLKIWYIYFDITYFQIPLKSIFSFERHLCFCPQLSKLLH